MLKRCLLAAVVASIALSLAAEAKAQKIYALLAADTLDPATGPSAQANVEHVASFLEQARGGLDLLIDEIKAEQFNCDSLSAAVDRVSRLSADDVFVFYYSGTRETVPGECADKHGQPEKYPIGEIIHRLRAKNPGRFLIVFVDNCNAPLSDPQDLALPSAVRTSYELDESIVRTAFRHLFLDYTGAVALLGAGHGESSYCANQGSSAGGVFSNQFLGAVYQRIFSDRLSVGWNAIVADAVMRIEIRTKEQTFYQRPQSDLQISERRQQR